MDEHENVIGFLGKEGILYCSSECSLHHGGGIGSEVDQDEYDALVEEDSIPVAGPCCPGCGAEFTVSWPDREPS